jgi:hypothetical protein
MAKWSITSTVADMVLSMEYDPTGLAWVRVYDNPIAAWNVDDTAPGAPVPVIIGSFPTAAPPTGSIKSPQWAHYDADGVAVPDVTRGTFPQFLTWLCTNNGAARQIACYFVNPILQGQYLDWAATNPGRYFAGVPFAADGEKSEAPIDDAPDFDRSLVGSDRVSEGGRLSQR